MILIFIFILLPRFTKAICILSRPTEPKPRLGLARQPEVSRARLSLQANRFGLASWFHPSNHDVEFDCLPPLSVVVAVAGFVTSTSNSNPLELCYISGSALLVSGHNFSAKPGDGELLNIAILGICTAAPSCLVDLHLHLHLCLQLRLLPPSTSPLSPCPHFSSAQLSSPYLGSTGSLAT